MAVILVVVVEFINRTSQMPNAPLRSILKIVSGTRIDPTERKTYSCIISVNAFFVISDGHSG